MLGTILKKYTNPCFKIAKAFLHYKWQTVGQKNFGNLIDPHNLIATVKVQYSNKDTFTFSYVYLIKNLSFSLVMNLHNEARESSMKAITENDNVIKYATMTIVDYLHGETTYELYPVETL